MDTYIVIDTIQIRIYGEWYERPIRAEVRAVDRDTARTAALALELAAAQRIDPHATARWRAPALVGAEPQKRGA